MIFKGWNALKFPISGNFYNIRTSVNLCEASGSSNSPVASISHVLGITLFENYSKCRIWILAFSTNFCPIKDDLSGNTVWPQASVFLKTRQNGPFSAFLINFCPLKCKRSSLLSQCWMRLFLWFSRRYPKWDNSSDFQTICIKVIL